MDPCRCFQNIKLLQRPWSADTFYGTQFTGIEMGRTSLFETLEPRRLLAASPVALLTGAEVGAILAQAASQAGATQAIVVVGRDGNLLGEYDKSGLTTANPAMTGEMIAEIRLEAALRAKTAAFFESRGEAFTTRTARFIIQDHFPQPLQNTAGGPLYGVEFSSGVGTDILSIAQKGGLPSASVAALVSPLGLSGDPGGIPLFKIVTTVVGNRVLRTLEAVGAIGVAGDFRDIGPRQDLVIGKIPDPTDVTKPLFAYAAAANPRGLSFTGAEGPDFDESVAMAGALGHYAPGVIQATHILLDGFRLPFTASVWAHSHHWQTLTNLLASGDGTMPAPAVDDIPDSYPAGTLFPSNVPAGITGNWVRSNERANPTSAGEKTSSTQNFLSVSSNDLSTGTTNLLPDSQNLTAADVNTIITHAVGEAFRIRGGIREPIGSAARVFVTVVDRDGDLLGAFRMTDTTRFSYDVAVQKARTAAFFSDDTHAFSTRSIGFISQEFFPPGIQTGATGPMYEVQDALGFAGIDTTGSIVDSSIKALGTVTASVTDPASAPIAVDAAAQGALIVGQTVTFGSDTAHEYLITSTNAGTITVQQDGIDPSSVAIAPLVPGEEIHPKNRLKNGITIFPGGVPLYKGGVLVGAIGVSGDGVDQDDIIAFTGTQGFSQFPPAGRSDQLSKTEIPTFISARLQSIGDTFNLGTLLTSGLDFSNFVAIARKRLTDGLAHLRLPFVKFPRNPNR